MKKLNSFWTVALSVLLLDILSKQAVLNYLKLGESVDLGLLSIVHVRNTGIAFGLFQGASWIFALIAGTVVLYLCFCYRSFSSSEWPVLGLVMAGAAGNMIDRIFFGSVVDFIDFGFWPAFNVADSAITVAIIWLLVVELRKMLRDVQND